ncbi:CLUMA_CG019915, isoform A [Clunio marinus]|uniref:CLUMA_CG019915, isoform A n=1 Tax=Clunio marinus TaxID=568069 RepID=A0A1J1J209_9DIPT|nr:CLUMA_CG019915, isoform A [Clunio marinus]
MAFRKATTLNSITALVSTRIHKWVPQIVRNFAFKDIKVGKPRASSLKYHCHDLFLTNCFTCIYN